MSVALPPPPPKHPSSRSSPPREQRPLAPASSAPDSEPTLSPHPAPPHHPSRPLAPAAMRLSSPTGIFATPPTPASSGDSAPAESEASLRPLTLLQLPAPASPVVPQLDPSYDPSDLLEKDESTPSEGEDEMLDSIASRIAARTEEEVTEEDADSWSSRIGAFNSPRARFMVDQTYESTEDPSSENPEMRRALDELEDMDVARFLERVGKRVQEVRIATPAVAVAFPEQSSFVGADGKTDWVAFGIAYLYTAAVVYTPRSLRAPPRNDKISLSVIRHELERYYILAPPSVLVSILEGQLARVWRWEHPDSWRWCLLYALLWTFDLIPMFPALLLIYFILYSRLYPPTPEQILANSADRTDRSREAAELSTQLKSTSRFGFAVEGAKGILSNLVERTSSSEGGALAQGLGGSAILGGAVGGLQLDAEAVARAKKKGREAPPSALARALVEGSSGIVGGVGALGLVRPYTIQGRSPKPTQKPTPRSPPSPMTSEPSPVKTKKEPVGTTSLYNLVTELARVFGPPSQDLMTQGADMGEKIKNVLVHSGHPSCTNILLRLVGICLVLFVVPTWIQIKAFWLYIGFEFFILWRLRERHSELRYALNPIWWLFLGAPTDAEYATWVIQKRSALNRPLRGSKTIKRMAKARARGGSDLSATGIPAAQVSRAPVNALGSRLSLTRSRASSLSSSRPPSIVEKDENIGSHFALYQTTPGTLLISSTSIRFASTIKGLRTFKRRLAKKFSHKHENGEAGGSDLDTELISLVSTEQEDVDYLMHLRAEDVVGVKKETRLGLDGLQITTRDGQTWRLGSVARRDEAFNKLLSTSPSPWQNS